MGRENERLTIAANISVEVPKDVILNVQADEPGSMVNLVPSTSNELWLIRLASIAGFETGSGGFLGTTPASSPVPFSFVGSDLEVSTYVRSGHAALGERISHTFDRRKSCNTGTAVSWRLKNGILFIDLVLAKRMTDEVTRGTHSKTGTKVFVAAGALRDEQQCLIFDLESVEDISMPSRPRTPYKPLDAYNNPCSVHSSVSLNTEQT